MTDQMKERVKLLLRGSSPDGETASHVVLPSLHGMPTEKALQVLTLAQRTAEDHVAEANRQAERSKAEARVAAARINKAAEEYAERIRTEAEQILDAARSAAELTARDTEAHEIEMKRKADLLLADAKEEADGIVQRGREQAEQLQKQAEQRYADTVGVLEVKREALQKQIEMLEVFNAEYRTRLTGFMQGQLRALWADQPEVSEDLGISAGK